MDALLISPDHLAQLEEHLLLMRRLLSESVPPARRRGWLTEQCRRRGDDERELWRALARYRQIGAAGLLTADRPRPTRFGRSHELVREGVLTRLIDTPRCVLGEFGPLAQLWEQLPDAVVEAFIERLHLVEMLLDPLLPEADKQADRRRYREQHAVGERTIRGFLQRYRKRGPRRPAARSAPHHRSRLLVAPCSCGASAAPSASMAKSSCTAISTRSPASPMAPSSRSASIPTTSLRLPSTTHKASSSRPPAPPSRSPRRSPTCPQNPPPSRRRYRPPPVPGSPACASSITPRCATAPRPRSPDFSPPPTTTTTRSTTMPMHDRVLAFFGFSRLPFGKHLQPADTFLSGAHQEALSRLSFGVADEDLLLLSGPIGCGKSVALAAFVAALDGNRYTPLYVRGSGLSASALVKAVLEGLKIDPPFFSGQASQLFFKTIPELNRKPVVIINDAQDLAATAITAIKSMVLCRPTEYAA